MKNKTISEYLDNEYTNYAMYVIESRALSSVIDGLKPTQRKIIHVANKIWKSGNEKPMKIFQLGGKIAHDVFYHHGDAGLYTAIINMAQKFKNNLPLLEEIGQFGSLRAPDAGAPRYISTKLHKNFRLVYKDFELLELKEEEGILIEPKYFLPIIPMILVNGSKGIAVGYAANILMRNPKDVIKQCLNYLTKKPFRKIRPKMSMYSGKFINDENNYKKWIAVGSFEKLNTTTLKITELSPSMTFEKFENLLENLVNNKHIISYDDNSKDNIDYIIKFNRQYLKSLNDDDIIKMFKLSETFTEDYNTLDEFGKLKIFDNVEDIIKYFVDFRLEYYKKRKEYMINTLDNDIFILDNKVKFIKAIIDNKLKVTKRKRPVIERDLEKLKIQRYQDSYNYLLNMNINSLTYEKYTELLNLLKTKTKELNKIKKYVPKRMYIEDLIELNSKL